MESAPAVGELWFEAAFAHAVWVVEEGDCRARAVFQKIADCRHWQEGSSRKQERRRCRGKTAEAAELAAYILEARTQHLVRVVPAAALDDEAAMVEWSWQVSSTRGSRLVAIRVNERSMQSDMVSEAVAEDVGTAER